MLCSNCWIGQSVPSSTVGPRSQTMSPGDHSFLVKSSKISKKQAVSQMMVLQQEKDQLLEKLLEVERESYKLQRLVAKLKEENDHIKKLHGSGSLCLGSKTIQEQDQEACLHWQYIQTYIQLSHPRHNYILSQIFFLLPSSSVHVIHIIIVIRVRILVDNVSLVLRLRLFPHKTTTNYNSESQKLIIRDKR